MLLVGMGIFPLDIVHCLDKEAMLWRLALSPSSSWRGTYWVGLVM